MKTKILSLILCFLIIFIFSSRSFSAEKKICNHCSQEITKIFIKVNDLYFHPSHFICHHCKSTIEGSAYYYENGKFYDDSCYQIISRLDCAYCKREIKGRYSVFENKNYHKDCYELVSAFPCVYCNKNITNSYTIYDNKNYHETCYTKNIALRCSLCAEVIEKNYTLDRYENKYHTSHKNNSTSCNYCGGYFDNNTSKKGTVYQDGRGICSICSQDAIVSMDELEPLLEEVNEKLKPYSFDIPLHKISVHLVDKDRLEQLVNDNLSTAQGYTIFSKTKNIFGMTLDRDINIYLLNGVTRMLMIKIIAHEFNHVWQGLQNSKEVSPPFSEGSCNYVAYLVLQQYPDEEAFFLTDNLFKDSDPDYGEGFRRVDNLVKEKGFGEWVNRLKKHTTFPSGF